MKRVIGIGGIGTGIFFELIGNDTLGRNESRAAHLLNVKDYCKGHIIMHYLAKLSGVPCSLWGKIGGDAQGDGLLDKMRTAGLDTSLIERTQAPTMFSVCFQYTDHAGGNITTAVSSCDAVDIPYISACLRKTPLDAECFVLCAPEVPLESRLYLMREARNAGAFVAASALKQEMEAFGKGGGYALCDLFSVNEEEAAAIGDSPQSCYDILKQQNPSIMLSVTLGKRGALIFHQGQALHVEARDVDVRSTAGAGDAFLAGLLIGLVQGKPLEQAAGIASTLAGFAVSCPDSICDQVEAWHIC